MNGNTARRFSLLVIVCMVALFSAACPDRKKIGELNANPAKYSNKDVVVAGTVRDSYGLNIPGTSLGGGAYKIDDGTGSIWVVVRNGVVPTRGSRLGVKGQLNTGVNFQGRNFGLAIMEKERRYDGK